MEYHFVYFPVVVQHSTMGQVFTFLRGEVVEYSASQNLTLETEDLERLPNTGPSPQIC